MEEVKSLLELTQKSIIEAGKRLIILKTKELHGGWLQTLSQIGIHDRFAERAMHAARRFSKFDNLSNLNASKMAALEDLTEKELDELDKGKDVLGLNLDDIDLMTAKEVRETAREGRKQLVETLKRHDEKVKSLEAVIRQKSTKIDDLEYEVRQGGPRTQEQLAAVSLDPLKKKLFEHVLMAQYYLDEAVKVVVQAQKVEGATFPQLQEWGKAHYEQLSPIGDLFDELDQALINCGPYDPNSTGM